MTELLRNDEDAFAIGVVDVPIGLSARTRLCDDAARSLLKPLRHNSVFRPPCRQTLAATTYRAAVEINKAVSIDGKGISQQAFHIRQRIKAVDDVITAMEQERIREGHPEVTFAVLNENRPLIQYKKTRDGIAERLRLLALSGVPSFDPHATRQQLGRSLVAVDDLIDAAAMLVTARRVHTGSARCWPGPPHVERDPRGLHMAIWS